MVVVHRVDRLLDELGRVVLHVVAQARRETLCQLGHGRQHLFGGGQGVGARALEDQKGYRWTLVQIAVGIVVLGAELDPGDVADACHPAVALGLDHDVLEFLRVAQAPERLDVQLEGALLWDRRLVQDARSDLYVLPAQRRQHVAGREVARRRLVRIEPDAHRIVARAEHPHVADTVDPGEHISDLQGRVVRDVQLVARAVRRAEMDHHQHVGRVLAHRDAASADVLGQARLGDRDAVLDQDLGDVEVGPEREGDGERQLAVAGRLGDHVEHVVDAVDLLLERRRHGFADDLGGGAGIARGDLDGGRGDLGVLRDRQRDVGGQPDQDDQDRADRREDRPVDEEMGEAHGG